MRPASFRSWHRVLLHQLHVVPPARHARGYGCDTRLVSYFSGLFRASLNVVLKRPSGACMFLVLITSVLMFSGLTLYNLRLYDLNMSSLKYFLLVS